MKHHKGKLAAVMAVVMLVSTLVFALPASAANPRTVISGSAFGAVLEWDLPDSIETDATGGAYDIASGQSFTLVNSTAYAFDILELTAATASGSPVTASPAATTVPANDTIQVNVSGTNYAESEGGVVLYIRYQDAASDLSGASTDYDIVHDSAYIPFEIHGEDEQETAPVVSLSGATSGTGASTLSGTLSAIGAKATSSEQSYQNSHTSNNTASNADRWITGNYYYDQRLYPNGFGDGDGQALFAIQGYRNTGTTSRHFIENVYTQTMGDAVDYSFSSIERYEGEAMNTLDSNDTSLTKLPSTDGWSVDNPQGMNDGGQPAYTFSVSSGYAGFRMGEADSYASVVFYQDNVPSVGSFTLLTEAKMGAKRYSNLGSTAVVWGSFYTTFYVYDTTAVYDAFQNYGGLSMSDYVMDASGRTAWTEYLSALAQVDYYLSNENPYLDQADMDAAAQRLEDTYTALTSGSTVNSALRAELYGLLQDLNDLLQILDADSSNYTPESVALFETRFAALSIPSSENWTDADAQTAITDIQYLLTILKEVSTTGGSTTESTTASTTESTTASTTESTTASTTESTTASTTESTTASTTESTTASTTESTTASTTEGTTAEPDVYNFLVEFDPYTGSEGSLTATVDADLDAFVALYVDGEELTQDTDFTLSQGSTVITLLDTYLDSLEDGEYPVEVRFTDGSAYTTLTIANTNTDTSDTTTVVGGGSSTGGDSNDDTLLASSSVASPNTGDTLSWILVPLAAATLSAGLLLILKRKREISL